MDIKNMMFTPYEKIVYKKHREDKKYDLLMVTAITEQLCAL